IITAEFFGLSDPDIKLASLHVCAKVSAPGYNCVERDDLRDSFCCCCTNFLSSLIKLLRICLRCRLLCRWLHAATDALRAVGRMRPPDAQEVDEPLLRAGVRAAFRRACTRCGSGHGAEVRERLGSRNPRRFLAIGAESS